MIRINAFNSNYTGHIHFKNIEHFDFKLYLMNKHYFFHKFSILQFLKFFYLKNPRIEWIIFLRLNSYISCNPKKNSRLCTLWLNVNLFLLLLQLNVKLNLYIDKWRNNWYPFQELVRSLHLFVIWREESSSL